MMTYGRGDPEVERVISEMNALNAALDSKIPATTAQDMVRAVEAAWPATSSVADFAIRAAMSKITGSAPPLGEPVRTSGEEAVWPIRGFELVATSWLAWTRGDVERARFWIGRWATEQAEETHLDDSGAIQAWAVTLWANAIEALIEGRADDARRFFRRVYEVGSSFGTESHPTVLWTMAASFFTPGG
jgi:hypothetical protein